MQGNKGLSWTEEHAAWVTAHRVELERAQERIGKTALDIARWLVSRFYKVDLSTLSAGSRLDLKWEVWVFARGTEPALTFPSSFSVPEDVDLPAFKDLVCDVVSAALEGIGVGYSFESYTILFNTRHCPLIEGFEEDRELYQYKVLHALAPYARALVRCSECERVFPKRQENQSFCSLRCLNRVAARDKRKRDRAEREKALSQFAKHATSKNKEGK